jgi:hypothetical protein
MRKLALLITIMSAAALIVWLPARAAQSAEEAAVRETIENYFRGHATGNGEYFKKAFHPDAKLFWIRDGQLSERTSADYIAGASGKPAPDEAKRKRRIESIDITGNAGIVKVSLDYPDAHIIDYMSMLKVNGEWKIVNKTFYVERKS